MAHRLLLLLSLLLLTACGAPAPKSQERSEPLGKVVVITDSLLLHGGADTLRLGVLRSGEQARTRLNLRNETSQPMLLLGEELTCGCIALDYERKPVAKSEHLPLQVDFDSRGLYGWQLKLFYLHLHGAAHPLKIYVEAELE